MATRFEISTEAMAVLAALALDYQRAKAKADLAQAQADLIRREIMGKVGYRPGAIGLGTFDAKGREGALLVVRRDVPAYMETSHETLDKADRGDAEGMRLLTLAEDFPQAFTRATGQRMAFAAVCWPRVDTRALDRARETFPGVDTLVGPGGAYSRADTFLRSGIIG